MIRLGLGIRQKEQLVNAYIDQHGIKQVFVLFAQETEQKLRFNLPHEAIEYDEWEMYRTFYPMIDKVDADTLIVVNEALRTRTYQDLKTNCATVWLRQTQHRIIFNYLPFIEEKEDFRILQKFNEGSKHVLEFEYGMLHSQDISVLPVRIRFNPIVVQTTEEQKKRYESQKEKLLAEVGESANMDPNNVPRKLQLLAGDFKKAHINPDECYLARNKRFKLANVDSIKEYDPKKEYIFLDLPTTKKELIDYLFRSKRTTISYVVTDLSIDQYLFQDITEWTGRISAFYAKANLYQQHSSGRSEEADNQNI